MMAPSKLPVRGGCFGYDIRSELEFAYLRAGGSGEPLEITAESVSDEGIGDPLKVWRPPRFPTHVRLYEADGTYQLWIADAGWFRLDPGRSRLVVPPDGDPLRREERIWSLPMVLSFLSRGDVPLHAASVEVAGEALILAAPGHFGKTTLAAAFAAAGYRVLSEDVTCVRPGIEPAVVPGPAMLRVRRDVADRFSVPGTVELGRDDDRVHLVLETKRGDCAPVPLTGIAFLQHADSEPRVGEVQEVQAVRDLWALSFNLPTEEDRRRSFRAVAALASGVAAWRLGRRLRLADLQASVEILVETVARGG